jgi:hypothetical protein
MRSANGTLRADDNRKPASAKSVRTYTLRAFGDRLPEVRAVMELVAVSLQPEELTSLGFRMDERFRPDVPVRAAGWER